MLSKQALLQAYRKMREIRTFEERLHQENTSGDIPGFIHLYTGEEAIAVGVCENLTSADFIGSTHRGHGHCIAKGCDIHGMMAEIFGKDSGLCRGKGERYRWGSPSPGHRRRANGKDAKNRQRRCLFYGRWWF